MNIQDRIDHNSCYLTIIFILLILTGCATPAQTKVLASAAIGLPSISPTNNIGQTYYLGIFDPHEQLPPTIYRLRVQGQASALSSTSFASGWVRADLVDSLSGRIDLGKQTALEENKLPASNEDNKNALNRRLIMFGPEGFREAPKNHRLVVVMGASPETFFNAVDRALGVVAEVTQGDDMQTDSPQAIWSDLLHMREEKRALQSLLDLSSFE